jgi:AcrR family transcriptional regulator
MASKKNGPGKVNRRREILQAAVRLMLSRGLSGVTTRQISREVGCSDAALYAHFKGRLELLLAMLEESLPEMLGPLEDLQQQVGRGSPKANLAITMHGIFRFHQRVTPIAAGLFGEPELLAAYRASLARQGKGPHLSMKALEDYIVAEQRLGRIDKRVDAKLAANVLLASSFFRAFSGQFFGRPMQPSWNKLVKQLIDTVAPATDATT